MKIHLARCASFIALLLLLAVGEASRAFAVELPPAPAADAAPLSAEETRAFMKRLADYAVVNHMKRGDSPQRGMMYEYFRPASRGKIEQYMQGEALDTMHDGSWFALALVNAYRATGDAAYKDVLVKELLPFYLKMLNHGDELFTADVNNCRPERRTTWTNSKEWLLQGREKGFVPYFWDDGGSVSLEMRNRKQALLDFPGYDAYTAEGKPNSEYRLSGYSLGSSNHLAQDLAVMLQGAWLLLRESSAEADRKLAEEVALGAKHLYECRLRHHGHIPATDAAWGLISGDEKLLRNTTDGSSPAWLKPKNHYTEAVRDFTPGKRYGTPGFADDQQYLYYAAIARSGGTLPRPLAFKLTFDAFTQPRLYALYCDDEPRRPGLDRFDLHPYFFQDGKPVDMRSQRKGPGGKPRPTGSRFGPQNMIVCGWALQSLKQSPGLWDESLDKQLETDIAEADVKRWLERELGVGLRVWRDIFDAYGYIPTGIGAGGSGSGYPWEDYSDNGGYAHLISAASQWLYYLDGRRDWEQHKVPAVLKATK